MKILTEDEKGVIIRLDNGMMIFMDDFGFSVKQIPNKSANDIRTTEWSDWLLMNDTIRKLGRGKPIHRRS